MNNVMIWPVQDWERLSAASRDLHTFWAHLDMKRREIEREEVGQGAAHRMGSRGKPKPSIPERIQHILTDLRDLMTKVNFQVQTMCAIYMNEVYTYSLCALY